MPSLINTDNAGNTFYNYITPVINGETKSSRDINYTTFLNTAWGGGYCSDSDGAYNFYIRPPAPGIETKTGTVSSTKSTYRFNVGKVFAANAVTTGLAGSTSESHMSTGVTYASGFSTSNVTFAVANAYSFIMCTFSANSLLSLQRFSYTGWLRESVYTGSAIYPLGAVSINLWQSGGGSNSSRVNVVGGTTTSLLSTAADSITSPPIVCTPGTDPGDGSETATDIVIRDAAAPNNPVGKLWNCIDLPSSSVVGGLYKNTGNYDGDSSESEQDVYLCVMPWGTRKLGMRVWTENVV